MKKITKFLIVIIILGVIIGAGIPIAYVYFFRSTTVSPNHVRIYVNSTIYSSLSTELSQYRQDIIDQGYTGRILTGRITT